MTVWNLQMERGRNRRRQGVEEVEVEEGEVGEVGEVEEEGWGG